MKNSKALLERKRPLFFAAGLLFAVSLTLVSFEWRTPYTEPFVPDWELEDDTPQEWADNIRFLPDPEKKEKQPDPPKVDDKRQDIKEVENKVETPIDAEPFVPEDIDELPTSDLKAEEPSVPEENLEPRNWADENPKYCGGDVAMLTFLKKNLVYPPIPLDNGVSGTVYVKFVVSKEGTLQDAKVVKSIDPWLDAEALRVAKMLSCFSPGKQGGKNVPVYFVLPVRFAIN